MSPTSGSEFDLTAALPIDQKRHRRFRAFYWGALVCVVAFILFQIWFGIMAGLGPFFFVGFVIGGVLVVPLAVHRWWKGEPTVLRVSASGIEFRFRRGRPIVIAWASGKFRMIIYPPTKGSEYYGQHLGPRFVSYGWRTIVVTPEGKDALLNSAMAHPLVTVLTGLSDPEDPESRRWDVRPRKAGDAKLPREAVA